VPSDAKQEFRVRRSCRVGLDVAEVDIKCLGVVGVQLEFIQNTRHQLVKPTSVIEVVASRGGKSVGSEKRAQKECILYDVSPKGVAVERAVGQPLHERIFEASPRKFRILIPQRVVQHLCLATSKLNL